MTGAQVTAEHREKAKEIVERYHKTPGAHVGLEQSIARALADAEAKAYQRGYNDGYAEADKEWRTSSGGHTEWSA